MDLLRRLGGRLLCILRHCPVLIHINGAMSVPGMSEETFPKSFQAIFGGCLIAGFPPSTQEKAYQPGSKRSPRTVKFTSWFGNAMYCFVFVFIDHICYLPDEEKSKTLSSNKHRLKVFGFLSLMDFLKKT